MPPFQLQIINAFVDGGRGGNPAGVVLDADDLSASEKQALAAKAGLSETAFVSRSKAADFKLEFFTPTRQIAHCGHATIGTFAYLKQLGRIPGSRSSKETIDGIRGIFFDGDAAFMEQREPRYEALAGAVGPGEVLASLGLAPADLLPGQTPVIVNTGNSFLVAGVASPDVLGGLRPDFPGVRRISEALGLVGYYVFTLRTAEPGRHAAARMFAPAYGIDEESATGMAAGPLACVLFDRLGLRQDELLIEQGRFMKPPSPSLLTARLELRSGRIRGLRVGGRAVVSKSLVLEA